MIISASRRTDIPAFYSEWFLQRIRAGYFHRVNPFNSRQVSGCSLKAEDVDAICFWTKNPRPLLPSLGELDERGLHYYFQFTLNPYDHCFEPLLPPVDERIATFRALAGRIAAERVIWRYDPVILSSATPVAWHLDQAERLAGLLQRSTTRLMFSFYDYYGKGRRLRAALAANGIVLEDITAPGNTAKLATLVQGFKAIADRYRLQIFTCSEQIDLAAAGIKHGACIDAKLLHTLFGRPVTCARDRHQRPDCGCAASVDMGSYNTCRYRCHYCYANFNQGMIAGNCSRHSVDSPSLLGQPEGPVTIRTLLHSSKTPPVQPTPESAQAVLSPEISAII